MASRSKNRAKYDIAAEYSAQRMSHPPNPAIPWAVSSIVDEGQARAARLRIADLGCGKLRHYALLSPISRALYLVDTVKQLHREHLDGRRQYTVVDFAKAASKKGNTVKAVAFHDFEAARLKLDAVFCVAVFDVIVRSLRRRLTRAASHNLRYGGSFVVIAPRNDSSILRRCSRDNRYMDGHVFHHHGITTFYANFRSTATIEADAKAHGLTLENDLSRYRQACLVFSKSD